MGKYFCLLFKYMAKIDKAYCRTHILRIGFPQPDEHFLIHICICLNKNWVLGFILYLSIGPCRSALAKTGKLFMQTWGRYAIICQSDKSFHWFVVYINWFGYIVPFSSGAAFFLSSPMYNTNFENLK